MKRKILAITMVASMLMGSSMVALADGAQVGDQSGTLTGSSEVQYVATDDVFNVVLPVVTNATTFNYIIDPSGLIAETNADRYGGKVFEDDKTVYFLHAAQVSGKDYTDTSDELTITNKSTQDVDVSVTAKVAAASGVVMAATSAMSGEGENLYLAITDGTNTEALTTAGVTLSATIAKDPAAYEVTWNSSTSKYERTLTTAAQAADYAGFQKYSFKLTGACKADDEALLALGDNGPAVDVTWTVKDFRGPSVSMTAGGAITISGMTAEKNFKTIAITGNNAAGQSATVTEADPNLVWDNAAWNATTGGTSKVQLSDANLAYWAGQNVTVTVTLSDDTTITTTTQISNG